MGNAESQQQKIDKLHSQLSDLESYVADLEDFVTDPVCVVGTSHIITDINQAFARMVGQSQSDIIGQSLGELFAETDVPKGLLDNPKEISSTRERDLHLKTNSDSAVSVRSRPWRDGADNLRGFFLGIQIREEPHKNANQSESQETVAVPKPDNSKKPTGQSRADIESLLEEVKEQQMRTQSVIYNIADGLLFVNPDQTVEMINPSALTMLDVKSGDVIGKKLSDLHTNKVLEELHKMVDNASGGVEREELTIGAETYFEVTTVHVGTEDGTAQQIIILHDITEKRKIEEMKLEFASVAAHQMRTPLSSIRWSFEILSKKLEDGELKSAVQRGYKSTQQVLQVVDELLNVDRLEEGQSGYSFEPVDVVAVLSEAIESERESQAVIEQPEIEFDKPVDDMPRVRGDSTKLRIVFKNLVENALKYTDSDKKVEIRVNMKMTSGYGGDVVLVTVEDSGIGIPESEQDKIFSKFYRANNATDTETEGTGVGLFITKQIVEAHKGKIWFDSEEGEGTTFYVQLPMASDT
jgi:PAS domain S-box-containing protein